MPFLRFFRGLRSLRDPALARLVDQLARARRIESKQVGEGGEASEVHAVFRQIAEGASRQQALVLLRHASPVVRGYLAGHVLAAFPEELEAIYPLLRDEAEVEEQSGCCYWRTTVADVVLAALHGHLDRPPIGQLLLRAALDSDLGDLRGKVVPMLAQRHPDEAAAVARALLREADPKVLEGAIRALRQADDHESFAEVAAFATSPHDRVRAAVASTLDHLGGPAAEPMLRQLAKDSDPYVRMMAGDSYVRQPGRDLAVVRELLRDPLPRVSSYVAAALGQAARDEDLGLLREYLADHPGDWQAVGKLPPKGGPGAVALMRDLLADARHEGLHARAIGYLHEARDRASLPLMRSALRADCISDRQAAAEALADLGDREAVSGLVALLIDTNPHGRLAGARALVRLGAGEAREALRRAAEADTSWARAELLALAGQLRGAKAKE